MIIIIEIYEISGNSNLLIFPTGKPIISNMIDVKEEKLQCAFLHPQCPREPPELRGRDLPRGSADAGRRAERDV